MTVSKLRSLAWQYAHINCIPGWDQKDRKAGKTWARYFKSRHKEIITVKKARNLSIARAMAANENNISKWFDEYEAVLRKFNIRNPQQIWSGDETGLQNVPKERLVIGARKSDIWQVVSGEQGETSTVLTFINAYGNTVPPIVIHKGERTQNYWKTDMPIGVTVTATTKGYITKEKFAEYGVRFIRYLRSHRLLGLPHLLLVDSHRSHVYNIEFMNRMKANNIHVMCIPAHCSHIVQALDSVPFALFKQYWQEELQHYNFLKRGKPLTKGDFWKVFWPAFKDAMSVRNIQAGFRRTGIYPVDFEAIDKSKFGPASLTDQPCKNC